MSYSEHRDFEIGLMLQQDPRAAEAEAEFRNEMAMMHDPDCQPGPTPKVMDDVQARYKDQCSIERHRRFLQKEKLEWAFLDNDVPF